jgi:hypothetical protein
MFLLVLHVYNYYIVLGKVKYLVSGVHIFKYYPGTSEANFPYHAVFKIKILYPRMLYIYINSTSAILIITVCFYIVCFCVPIYVYYELYRKGISIQ